MIRAGAAAGAEGVFETFSDLNELRAGVLAAKECSDLPVFASMTFEASGRTFLGCRADAAAMALDALGVDALGVNCSLGPKEIAPILQAMRTCTNLPLILKPNAGLPDPETGAYHTAPDEFARDCAALTDVGAAYIGGCCGTTPAFIEALGRALEGKTARWDEKDRAGNLFGWRNLSVRAGCSRDRRANQSDGKEAFSAGAPRRRHELYRCAGG